MSWTDERVELLRKLWLEGLSASQIATCFVEWHYPQCGDRQGASARSLGPGQGLGAERAAAAQQSRCGRRRPATAPRRCAATRRLPSNRCRRRSQEPEPLEDVVIPISERVTIMELKEAMCRWPLGDPTTTEFRFCGAKKPIEATGPYCAYHSRIAYQPVQERRRERDRERRAQKSA